MQLNLTPEQFKQYIRFMKAKVLNGDPDVCVNPPTKFIPFKYQYESNTRIITDLTEETNNDIVISDKQIEEKPKEIKEGE